MATNGENGTPRKREQTAQRIIEAIQASNGLLTLAAKRAGVSYTTVWRYTQDFPSVKQAVIEAKEQMVDFAEGKLYEKIRAGDNTAIIFFLKTQAKHRGYIERAEIGGIGGEPIRHDIDAKGKLAGIINSIAAKIEAPASPEFTDGS